MRRAAIPILMLLMALAAWPAVAAGRPAPIVLEAEDALPSLMSGRRSRLMNRRPYSGRGYWAIHGAGERLTFRFEAPAGRYFIWMRARLDPKEATDRRRLSVTLENRLVGYVDRGNDRRGRDWTWHRLGPAQLSGGRATLVIKKLLNSPRPAAVDVIHLSRDPRYRP